MSDDATVAVTSVTGRLQAWFANHRVVSAKTLADLLSQPVASLMTWLMIGIALALPAILYVLLVNFSQVSGQWGGKPRISLYLNEGVTSQAGASLAQRIERMSEVEVARFISQESALREFQEHSGFGDVLSTLDDNPLPHVVEVVPATADPLAISQLATTWQVEAQVNRVSVDMEWLERLFAIIRFGERLVMALSLVLGAGVVLVMGNTIRLAILNRRAEIEIVKLFGASDAFVRRPFLYLGFWYGLGGALAALVLAGVSLQLLAGPVEELAKSYRDGFALSGLGVTGALGLVAVGVLVGLLGAILAVGRHLREIEPS